MGFGTQVGTFVTVSALAIKNNGGEVLVADSANNKITLFKITDFGIAMALNSTQLTQTNSVMGSVHYLPPE